MSFKFCYAKTETTIPRNEYDLCKYNFTVRVIRLWNSLPTHVITAVSVDSFKNRLDKFWANEEARFEYKASQLIWQRFCKMLLNLMLRLCKMRAQRPQAYAHSCTFMFMFYVYVTWQRIV